mgnify:CR=1 FL=1
MLKFFRVVSVLEGMSYLVILSVTIGVLSREFVFQLGMTHGVLFTAYLLLSLLVSNSKDWSVLIWLAIFLSSLIPFAFIPVELFLRKEESKAKVGVNLG